MTAELLMQYIIDENSDLDYDKLRSVESLEKNRDEIRKLIINTSGKRTQAQLDQSLNAIFGKKGWENVFLEGKKEQIILKNEQFLSSKKIEIRNINNIENLPSVMLERREQDKFPYDEDTYGKLQKSIDNRTNFIVTRVSPRQAEFFETDVSSIIRNRRSVSAVAKFYELKGREDEVALRIQELGFGVEGNKIIK